MKYIEETNLFVVRLDDGEDFNEKLQEFLESQNIRSGIILSAIGMVRDLKLAYYQGKEKFRGKVLTGPFELVSSQGNIATMNEKRIIHLHMTVADEKLATQGGHFQEAIVHNTAEIVILKLGKSLKRKFNPQIGLNLLDI